MTMADVFNEVELDPFGYAARPDLFVRNLTRQPITFNLGKIRWLLEAKGNVGDEQPLPWTVAKSSGFERVWERGDVEVAIDPDFQNVIEVLPGVGSVFRPYVHVQSTPQAVTTIKHDHSRPGPVMAALYSLDGEIEYFNFTVEMVDKNTCRIAADDPIAFIATVF
ncbi:hypothetical protein MYRNA_110 [Mycobacterium phage Myrna]|uniref:Uncharacterized protein n=1 Tax=Mycobacterium phage Myrna TaxID=546805 RepID=B5LJB4_9CAUD|nr:gp110 [Mycobacterium phage Myrna]ACH62111.1 hypothetical protein MYRNA_110 [Mycobacterium phage Myrna]